MVAVSDLSTAQLVRQAGAIPKLVRFTADQLNAVQAELNRLAVGSSAGKVRSWYVDPISGTVVVTVPKGARDLITERFLERAKANGDQVTIRKVSRPGDHHRRRLQPAAAGSGWTRTPGTSARSGSTRGPPRAPGSSSPPGTARPASRRSRRNGYVLGNTRTSSFPGNDFGTVGVIEGWDQQGYVEGWGAGNVAVKGTAERDHRLDAVQVG